MRLPRCGDLDALDLAGRHVDVEQRALGQRHVVDLLHQPRGERRGGVEVEAVAEPEVHLAALDCCETAIAGDAEDDALQRGGDGARVGDVVAEVGAVVDAGDDQVGGEAVDQPQRGEAHAVDGRAVGRVADGAVAEVDLLHPQRAARGDRAGGGGRLPSGAMTASSTSSIASSARRSACSPSASMPSSLVSRTRSTGPRIDLRRARFPRHSCTVLGSSRQTGGMRKRGRLKYMIGKRDDDRAQQPAVRRSSSRGRSSASPCPRGRTRSPRR